MAGAQKAVHPEVHLPQQGPEGGGRGFQQAQQGEVFESLPLGLQHRQGGAGGGGLKPHSQKHHLFFRVGFGQLQGIHGGVHHLDVRPQGLLPP